MNIQDRLRWLADVMFGCPHPAKKRTRVFKDDRGCYVICLDCGAEFKYDWKEMKMLGRRSVMPSSKSERKTVQCQVTN